MPQLQKELEEEEKVAAAKKEDSLLRDRVILFAQRNAIMKKLHCSRNLLTKERITMKRLMSLLLTL